MKIQIELKSVLLGLGIGTLAMLTIGAAQDDAASPKPIGKYQATTGAGFAFIIDTTTGKAWFANVSAANKVNVDAGFFEAKDGR